MKKLISSSIGVLVLALPTFAIAAYNDIELASDVNITLGSITLTVHGQSAILESITVNGDNFSFPILSNSTISVRSANGYTLSHNAGSSVTVNTYCATGDSRVSFSLQSGNATSTITVTPSTTACTPAASGSGGGNGPVVSSGGGGTTPTTVSAAQTTQKNTTQITAPSNAATILALAKQLHALIQQLKALGGTVDASLEKTVATLMQSTSSPKLTRDLQVGSTGEDVKALQMYLNAHGYLVAESGPGSPGQETVKFGNATKAALIRLQKVAGISPSAGYCGAKTRAYIEANP